MIFVPQEWNLMSMEGLVTIAACPTPATQSIEVAHSNHMSTVSESSYTGETSQVGTDNPPAELTDVWTREEQINGAAISLYVQFETVDSVIVVDEESIRNIFQQFGEVTTVGRVFNQYACEIS